jgi:outer membrane protein assembly factor BamC
MTCYGSRAVAALLLAALAGCGTTMLDPAKVDYKAAAKQTLPPLEIPPDLTAPARDDRFQIPDTAPAAGSTTLSAYNAERTAGGPKVGTTQVLPDIDKVKIVRAGSERWLVVPEPPEKVWPKLKEFWQENGLLVKTESPETGIMETDWAENRAKVDNGMLRNFLGGVLNSVYSTGEMDKYRTRLERGADPNTTEIYITHRGMEEVYTSAAKDNTIWQPRPPDPGLEAEFLRKLMVKFGVDDAKARVQLAEKLTDERAKIVNAQDGVGTLHLEDPFDRAWRRVGLALDRVGFTVEDRDRSKGFYFVRYVDPEVDAGKKDDGVLSKLAFWRSSKPDNKSVQYRVSVKDRTDSSDVQVLNKDGDPDRTDTGRKILSLLQEQLK